MAMLFSPSTCLLQLVAVAVVVAALPEGGPPASSLNKVTSQALAAISYIRNPYQLALQGKAGVWEMVQIVAICSIIPGFWYLRRKQQDPKPPRRSSSESLLNGGLTPATYKRSADLQGKLIQLSQETEKSD